MLSYDEIISSNGINIPFVPHIITPKIERPMRNNRYEGGECKALRELLQSGDRVLELGAGVGLLSSIAAQISGVESITAVEANPELLPMIRETHSLNKISNVDLRLGVVSSIDSEDINFYIRKDFWASSMEPDSRPYIRIEKLPNLNIADLFSETSPTVIVSDIEGAELGLFDSLDLSNIRCMILEFHPKVYGEAGSESIISVLKKQGLSLLPTSKSSSIKCFLRQSSTPTRVKATAANTTVNLSTHSISKPKVLISTCMKDEGPFIIEWLSWHKAMGVSDVVVFTNDCSDGTVELLDHLNEIGEVIHLPNPAVVAGSTFFQPIALKYTEMLPQFRSADYFISMDVDEFINVRSGQGHLSDLFSAVGKFDVLSMSELNHGSNRNPTYKHGWITELFPQHQTTNPGKWKAQRGVKSIVRVNERVERIRNHRPDINNADGQAIWIDGSGRPLDALLEDSSSNGIDCRNTYDAVILDHYPLRSLESYLVKMLRGDVVIKGKRVSHRYWRIRNQNGENTTGFQSAQIKAARSYYNNFLSDEKLKTLHETSCLAHETQIKKLLGEPDFLARKDWILSNAWD